MARSRWKSTAGPERKKRLFALLTGPRRAWTTCQMEKCVGGYGEDTSGQIRRGVFGMGLKDTINAFGQGTITSFKNGKKHRCTLTDVENLALESAQTVSRTDKQEFRNTHGGTVIEIEVNNPDVRIPFIDSLRQQLQMRVSLRGIMTNPRAPLFSEIYEAAVRMSLSTRYRRIEVLVDQRVDSAFLLYSTKDNHSTRYGG